MVVHLPECGCRRMRRAHRVLLPTLRVYVRRGVSRFHAGVDALRTDRRGKVGRHDLRDAIEGPRTAYVLVLHRRIFRGDGSRAAGELRAAVPAGERYTQGQIVRTQFIDRPEGPKPLGARPAPGKRSSWTA